MKSPQEELEFLVPAFKNLFAEPVPDLARFVRLVINVLDPLTGYDPLSSGCSPKRLPRRVVITSARGSIGGVRSQSDSGVVIIDTYPVTIETVEKERSTAGEDEAREALRLLAEKHRRGIDVLKQKSEEHGAQVCTTDGRPPDPDYAELGNAPRPIGQGGQHESYYVLCDAERQKGFVRPVRKSYRHIVCGSITRMGVELAETYARDPKFYGGTMCCGCRKHFPLVDGAGKRQFIWIGAEGSDQEGVGE